MISSFFNVAAHDQVPLDQCHRDNVVDGIGVVVCSLTLNSKSHYFVVVE